jgi:uncharacterized protein YbjT (DUF2867 family)
MNKFFTTIVLALLSALAHGVGHENAAGNALVFGGNGRLGAPIVRGLVEAGHPVTVFVRETSDLSRIEDLDLDYVVGDLTDADTVVSAIGGRDFAYVIDATARRDFKNLFYDTSMRNILDALAGSEVQQFILHGSVGAGDNVENFPDVPFGSMKEMLKAKGRAEDMLRASGIDYTIIRNGRIVRGEPPPTGKASLTEDDTVMSSITRADLALLTLDCVGNRDCYNKTYHAQDKSL